MAINSSFGANEAMSLKCAFVNVTFYRDQQELVLNIATCVLNVVFAITSTLLNSAVLLAIWKTRALHTPSNILLCGLAASDLAVGCVVQPLYITMKILQIHEDIAPYCIIRIASETLTLAVSGTSFITLTFIAVERYLALYLHLRYKALVTCQRMAVCLAISWLLSISWATFRFWLSSRTFAMITGLAIVICLLVNTWAYFQIWRLVKRHKTQINKTTSSLQAPGSTVDISKYKKTVITMAALLLILFVSYAPFVGVTNSLAFGFGGKTRRALFTAYSILANWILATSSLNPVLYCWRLREIREAAIKVFFHQN